MANTTGERWAVLVGIDRYSESSDKINLHGCVSHVEGTAAFLKSSLGIPSDHITVLTSEKVSHHDVSSHAYPTKANVVRALREIAIRSKPGDFLYFHYSGHGDRLPTIN